MVDTPTPAVNGHAQQLGSQEQQAAQIHSGHLRAYESQFSSHIHGLPAEEETVASHSRRSTAKHDFPASDIQIPIAQSTKSNILPGAERGL